MPRKPNTKVRNRRAKVRRKRKAQNPTPGSARQDKVDLIPGAISPATEQQIISKLVSYDREVWPITPAIKQKAVATVERCMQDANGFVANMAVANLVKMEGQNVEANKKEPQVQPPAMVQVNVNQSDGPPAPATSNTRLALISAILESAAASSVGPGDEQPDPGNPGHDSHSGGDGDAAGGNDAGPVAMPVVEFPL